MNVENIVLMYALITGLAGYLGIAYVFIIEFNKWLLVVGVVCSVVCLALTTLLVGEII